MTYLLAKTVHVLTAMCKPGHAIPKLHFSARQGTGKEENVCHAFFFIGELRSDIILQFKNEINERT